MIISKVFVHVHVSYDGIKSWLPVLDNPTEWCLYQMTLNSKGNSSSMSHTEFKSHIHILDWVCRVYQEFSIHCCVQMNTRQTPSKTWMSFLNSVCELLLAWSFELMVVARACTDTYLGAPKCSNSSCYYILWHIITMTVLGCSHTILSYGSQVNEQP